MREDEAIELLERVSKAHGKDFAVAVLSAVSLGRLTSAVRSVAHGDERPGGLEGVAMALAGERIGAPVSEALHGVQEAITRLASAVEDHGE